DICLEALQHQFASVCIPPYFVPHAKALMEDSTIKVTTVAGFPFGYARQTAKKEEIIRAIHDGADEIDLVVNLCALREQDWKYLEQEILLCIQPVRLHGKVIKIIIETGLLQPDMITACCQFYQRFKPDFIKTSTGYAERGATVETIAQLRAELPAEIKIKASGGIRTYAFASQLIAAGADRIGTSSGSTIIQESQIKSE